jgi:hypothetical protein
LCLELTRIVVQSFGVYCTSKRGKSYEARPVSHFVIIGFDTARGVEARKKSDVIFGQMAIRPDEMTISKRGPDGEL